MSVLNSSNYYKFEDGELRKNQELMMDSSSYYLQQNNNHQHQNSNTSPGLMRYRSAPCSFFENLVNGTSTSTSTSATVTATTAAGFEDYRCSSLESEAEALFMMSSNGTSGTSASASASHEDHMVLDYGDKCVKQELDQSQSASEENGRNSNGSEMMYRSSYGLPTSLGNENGSNLIRQSSSPAEFFSNLGLDDDDGFNVMRKVNTFQACDGTKDESKSSSRVYHDHNISFTSGPSSSRSRHMPGIAEVENENMGMNGPESGHFMSWSNASLSGFKRARESTDRDLFCNLHVSQTQNQDYRDRPTALTHHLSLPKTSAEMAAVEKLWQFEGSVPCKIRAKRGCATHPRSIAERVRRTRISERMRKLQGLFPNIDKQTNTADMLDMAVEYIKDLQKQVKTLTDTKAKCACS